MNGKFHNSVMTLIFSLGVLILGSNKVNAQEEEEVVSVENVALDNFVKLSPEMQLKEIETLKIVPKEFLLHLIRTLNPIQKARLQEIAVEKKRQNVLAQKAKEEEERLTAEKEAALLSSKNIVIGKKKRLVEMLETCSIDDLYRFKDLPNNDFINEYITLTTNIIPNNTHLYEKNKSGEFQIVERTDDYMAEMDLYKGRFTAEDYIILKPAKDNTPAIWHIKGISFKVTHNNEKEDDIYYPNQRTNLNSLCRHFGFMKAVNHPDVKPVDTHWISAKKTLEIKGKNIHLPIHTSRTYVSDVACTDELIKK